MASFLHLHKKSIQKDLLNKMTYTQIAEKYNITRNVVAGFINRNLKNVKENQINKSINIKECKYPIGDPKLKTFKFCKDKVKENSVYCKTHYKQCYIKPILLKY